MITSLLSQRKNGKNITYLKLIIYEVRLLQNAKNIKNIFPYIISVQFNQSPEKIISPIKNAKEIFKISNTNFKYFIRDKEKINEKLKNALDYAAKIKDNEFKMTFDENLDQNEKDELGKKILELISVFIWSTPLF